MLTIIEFALARKELYLKYATDTFLVDYSLSSAFRSIPCRYTFDDLMLAKEKMFPPYSYIENYFNMSKPYEISL